MGQKGKLELQPGVGTGMVEEADILSLEERHGNDKPGPRSLPENLNSILGASLKKLPGWPHDPSTIRSQDRKYWRALPLAAECSFHPSSIKGHPSKFTPPMTACLVNRVRL